MNKLNFKDYPLTETPMSAHNLNLMQSNIEEAYESTLIENENGIAIKYPNGIMICYRTQTFQNVGCATNYGTALYRSDTMDLGNYPAAFKEIPSVKIDIINTSDTGILGNYVGDVYAGTSTKPPRKILIKPTNTAILSITLGYIAIGKWK